MPDTNRRTPLDSISLACWVLCIRSLWTTNPSCAPAADCCISQWWYYPFQSVIQDNTPWLRTEWLPQCGTIPDFLLCSSMREKPLSMAICWRVAVRFRLLNGRMMSMSMDNLCGSLNINISAVPPLKMKGSDDSERPSSNDKARIDFSTRILSALCLFDTWFIQSIVNEFCVIIV